MKAATISSIVLSIAAGASAAALPTPQGSSTNGPTGQELGSSITKLVGDAGNARPNNLKDLGTILGDAFNIDQEGVNLGTGSNIHKRQDLQSAIEALIRAAASGNPKNPADVGTVINDAFNIAQEGVNLGTGSKVHKRQDLQSAIEALIRAAASGNPKNPADVGAVINDAFNIAQEGVNLGTGSKVHKRQDLQSAIEALIRAATNGNPKNPADVGTTVNSSFNVVEEAINLGTGSKVHKRQDLQSAIAALVAAAKNGNPKNPADVGTTINSIFNVVQEAINTGTGSKVHKRQDLQSAIEALINAARNGNAKNPADVGTVINDAFNIAQEGVNLGTGSSVH